MALSLPRASRPEVFERHIKRLAWCALLAGIALLVPIVGASIPANLELAVALGASVLVVAVFAVVRDVDRYVREERVRQREVLVSSRQRGACEAASTIHDRVANLLSLTVGYVELLAEDELLSSTAREQAGRALDGALSAARMVSAYKQSLGCDGEVAAPELPAARPSRPATRWWYDSNTRTLQDQQGGAVANLSPALDDTDALANGRLLAEAPLLWNVLADAQQLSIALLAGRTPSEVVDTQTRELLERINTLADRLEA
jgi:hypothetical protein